MPPSFAVSDPFTAGLITLVASAFRSATADSAERNQQSPVAPCMMSNGLNPSTMNSPFGLKMTGNYDYEIALPESYLVQRPFSEEFP